MDPMETLRSSNPAGLGWLGGQSAKGVAGGPVDPIETLQSSNPAGLAWLAGQNAKAVSYGAWDGLGWDGMEKKMEWE